SKSWREQCLKNVEEVVLQYRNHPSVFLWGVRINESLDCDERLFKSVVKTSFGQRRKTLRNSLRGMIPPESMPRLDEQYGEVFKRRPEQLGVDEFIELTNIIKNLQNKE
ncbi:MAG: hypothetical protein IJ925_10055, partial [Muribaculaceae bacterium]|nr:hypothetical protein [Muribaculaceae bacterium]